MALFLLLVSVYPKTGNAADNSGGTAEDDKRRFEKEFADQKLRAEQGDPKSQYQWGLSCIYDQQGSLAEGLRWLLLASKQGYVDAEAEAGGCYAFGIGTEVNADEAIRLLRDAASKGSARALNQLGFLSINGLGPLPKDLNQAEKFLLEAIKKGAPWAEKRLQEVRDMLKKQSPTPPDGKPSP